jgi:hypothetical protein
MNEEPLDNLPEGPESESAAPKTAGPVFPRLADSGEGETPVDPIESSEADTAAKAAMPVGGAEASSQSDTVEINEDESGELAPSPALIQDEESEPIESPAPALAQSGAWAVALLCIGLFVTSACVLLPQVDANRRMVYDREKLRLDLQQIQKQVTVNREFLGKVESDPQLSERLALRQMRVVRPGERVLDFKNEEPDAPGAPTAGSAESEAAQMSPFMIVNVPPPPPLPEYEPVGGFLGAICMDQRFQLYLLGGALFSVAAGLVLGDPEPVAST